MERLEISKLFSSYEELGGKEITVCGWIKTLRDSKAIGFMEKRRQLLQEPAGRSRECKGRKL